MQFNLLLLLQHLVQQLLELRLLMETEASADISHLRKRQRE